MTPEQFATLIDAASAKYDNGVLTLTLPKKRAAGGVQRLVID